jgi:hypothetical protein
LNGQEYQPEGLHEVKWQNLGWRFGRALGRIPQERQKHIFEILADLQVAERVNDVDDDDGVDE